MKVSFHCSNVVLVYTILCTLNVLSSEIQTNEEVANSQNKTDKFDLNLGNSYCDFSYKNFTKCDFSNTTAEIILTGQDIYAKDEEAVQEIELNQPTRLILREVCFPSTKVIGAKYVSTMAIPNKSFSMEVCRTSLQVINSTAGDISVGVRDLLLQDSTVKSINLIDLGSFKALDSTIIHLEHIEWRDTGIIENSVIHRVSAIRGHQNLLIVDSHFGDFKARRGLACSGRRLQIVNSTVNHIGTYGWVPETDEFLMENVTIDSIDALGIVLYSSIIIFRNVTILNAKQPFISLPLYAEVSFEDVEINGNQITPESHLVTNQYYSSLQVLINTNTPECRGTESLLRCNFKNEQKITFYLPRTTMRRFKTIEISNAPNLEIDKFANNNIYLVNSTVKFLYENLLNCPSCIASVLTNNCTITSLLPSGLNTVYLEASKIASLFVGRSVRRLLVYGCKIDNFRADILEGAEIDIYRSEIINFYPSSFRSPVRIFDTSIKSLDSMKLVHHGKKSIMKENRISLAKAKAFDVQEGILIFVNNTVTEATGIFINIQTNGSLKMNAKNVIPKGSLEIISATSLENIEISTTNSPFSRIPKKAFVFLLEEGTSYPDSISITSHNSPYCQLGKDNWDVVCDFENATEENFEVFFGRKERSTSMTIWNPKNIILKPSCLKKIHVHNAKNGKVLMEEENCGTELNLNNSSLSKVFVGVDKLNISNSHVGEITSVNPRVNIVSSKVEHVKDVRCEFFYSKDSQLDKVSFLHTSRDLQIDECTIDEIEEFGIMISETGLITNSFIGNIPELGIIIENLKALIIKNTVIERLEKSAFFVNGGLLLLINVNIRQGFGASFVTNKSRISYISCHNVTLGGWPLNCISDSDNDIYPWTIKFPYQSQTANQPTILV